MEDNEIPDNVYEAWKLILKQFFQTWDYDFRKVFWSRNKTKVKLKPENICNQKLLKKRIIPEDHKRKREEKEEKWKNNAGKRHGQMKKKAVPTADNKIWFN